MSQSHSCNVLTGAEFNESVEYIMGNLNSEENDSSFCIKISSLIASSKQRVMNVFPFSTNDSECIEVSCDTFEILELLFKAILLRITSTQKNKCQVETNILQNAVEIIETLTNLLDETVKCNQVKNVNLLSKKNIAGSTLHVIHGSYVHCQSSETTYGDNFPSVAALLGDLFRKTFRLQKALTTILGKANVLETCNPEACEGLLVVCSRLLEICHVVADMDCALMGMSWKLLSSFMCKYQQFLSMKVSLGPYILELLEKISKFLQQATDEFSTVANETRQGDNDFASIMKKVASSLRMASFLMGFLSTLLSQYCSNFDGGHCSYLTDFVFSAVKILQFRFILKSSDASTLPIDIQKLIFSHFQPEFDKLLLLLSSSAQFQHRLKNSGSDEAFVELYILLRLSVVLGTSQSDSTVWFGMSDNTSIVSLLFNLLPSFYCQLNQRYCMYTGDQESLLYEVILTHLCGCIFATPQSSFGYLETVLLQNLTSVNPYQSSLAADLWCFLARLSPASLCYHYVQVLSLVVASFPPNTVVTTRQRRVCWLLGRLFKFLTPNQQIALFDLYPITEDKNITVVASFGSHLTCCSFQRITSFLEIVTTALKDFLEADGVASQVNRIESYLCILCSIFDGFKYDQEKGNILNRNREYKEVCSCLSASVVCLWKFLNCNCSLQRTLVTFSSQLCRLTSFLWEYMSKEDTEIILRKVKEVTNASLETREELCYSIALLLTGLRHVHLSQTALGDLIFLWKLILSQAEVSWLLHHSMLDAFELFSKVTKHPELVAMVCADNGLNTRDCDVMSLIKSHLMREITPLPENVSIEMLLKHHQGALKSSVYVSEIINSVSESTELHDVIGDITNNLNTLKRISKEALDSKTRTLLKELLTTVENLLPCEDE
ncbi:unnamed protein product [Clavelina lepadiformis]|uniref:Protein MMS22-like n=1 Tax=Clavelina lepadiformis TaxID=159417 RepID=A0ABP0F312_CLALP